MEGFAKVVLILTVFLGALSMDVNGGRILKAKEEVDRPQTIGIIGGTFPSPFFSGSFPNPGSGGSFPSPYFSGPFPSPGFGGSFPSPGLSGAFPSPSLGFGLSTFCSLPGIECAPVQIDNSARSDSSARVGGSP